MKTTNSQKLSCMWTAAKWRFDETDKEDEVMRAYWLGKIDATDEALRILELEDPPVAQG